MNDKKTVLIIEDEPSIRKAIMDKLETSEFLSIEAKNGEEGLIAAFEKKPDLILLDILMPKMDGMVMMKKLREEGDWGKKVPIIILTNLSADDRITSGVVINEPAYYLMKTDWSLDEVVAKIRSTLEETENK